MPDGSSSAAPVINPGPRLVKNLRKRPCRTKARRAALVSDEFWINGGTGVLLRRETSLPPAILPESPCLAKAHKHARRFPAHWPRTYRVPRWFPDTPSGYAGKL